MALHIAKTYVAAIASKDVHTIISISADQVVCISPIVRMKFDGFRFALTIYERFDQLNDDRFMT